MHRGGMMKEVLMIHGGRRKQNTYAVLMQVKKILEAADVHVRFVSLHDYVIGDCIGCEECMTGGTCGEHDDIAGLLGEMKRTDGIILSSPVYLRQVSGRMKSFIDRTCCWFHCPPLANKPILAVSTTMGSGLKDTLIYLESVAEQWGAMQAGTIGRDIRTMNHPVEASEVACFLELLNNPKSYKPTLKNLINFQVQKALALHVLTQDKPYWEKRNWTEEDYYQEARISPIKRFIAKRIGRSIQKGMSEQE